MGSKQWEDMGAERGTETGRMYPEDLTIVGLDVTEDFLLARYPTDSRSDQNARAAISSCRDKTRLQAPDPYWIEALAMGNPPPIECYRLPLDCRGKLWVIVFGGKHRTMGTRTLNARCKKKAERQKVEIKLRPLRPENMTRGEALIAQAGSNNHIPESLETRAARALEMREQRLAAEVIITMLAQGGGQPVIDDLCAWAEIFPRLSEEAARLANAGQLKLGRARRLAKLRPEEQDAALQATKKRHLSDSLRPVSPARLRSFLSEAKKDPKTPEIANTLLGVLSGEASPEKLPDGLFAAWNRACERGRATVAAQVPAGEGEDE